MEGHGIWKAQKSTNPVIDQVNQFWQIEKRYDTREFKKWRGERKRQRDESMIWLVQRGKNYRAARAARTLVQFFNVVCQKTA